MSRSFEEEMFSNSEGLAILSSCKMGQLSYEYEEKSHGVFSYYLLEGLMGEADTDKDRVITVPDTNKYIAKKMHEWCIENGFQQDPTLQYDVSGDLFL